jgi:hypothetical protein
VGSRRLPTWGAEVAVYLTAPPDRLSETTRLQLSALQRMDVPVQVAVLGTRLPRADLVIDALKATASGELLWALRRTSSVLPMPVTRRYWLWIFQRSRPRFRNGLRPGHLRSGNPHAGPFQRGTPQW